MARQSEYRLRNSTDTSVRDFAIRFLQDHKCIAISLQKLQTKKYVKKLIE